MITRSKRVLSTDTQQRLRKKRRNMADHNVAERVESTEESIESPNNQLGLRDIWEDVPQIEAGTSGIRGRGLPVSTPEEVAYTSTERSEEFPTTPAPLSDLERIIMMMQGMREEFRASIYSLEAKTDAAQEEIKNTIKEEINELKKENLRMHKEARADMKRIEAELHKEMHDIRTEVKVIQEGASQMRDKVDENSTSITKLRMEVTNNVTQTQGFLNESIHRINAELRGEMKTTQEETIKVIRQQHENEEKKRIEEMTREQEILQRRVNEVEGRGVYKLHATDITKEVTFNGHDHFPMEFLRELTELQERYHLKEDTAWIGRHLTDEAKIWWRIVKHKVNDFEEFREKFTDKYWSEYIQEQIRDRLEYGYYTRKGNFSMVQYMERSILQCRPLIPPISDQQLIKKLSKHFTRDVEVGVVTRGIKDIPQFEALLREYENINRPNYNTNDRTDNKPNNGYIPTKKEKVEGERPGERDRRDGHKGYFRQYVDSNLVTAGSSGVTKPAKNGGAAAAESKNKQ